jgi:2-hydroxymethylglutarate dehydrogenase
MKLSQIGMIGVGEMGFPMAKNLIREGYGLSVFDVVEEPLLALEKIGAHVLDSPRAVAAASEMVIVMVRTTEQAERVIAAGDGILDGARPGTVILVMATVDPMAVRKWSQSAEEKGVTLLDAPVSGARQGAEAGTLTIMVGGPEEGFERAKPVLEVMGKNIFYLGDGGMGEIAKLLNNLLLLINMTAAYEAMSLAEKSGLRMDVLRDLIRVSTGNSWVMEHWDIVKSWKQDYRKGGTLDLIYKDIDLTLKLGEEIKVPLLLSSVAKQLGRY